MNGLEFDAAFNKIWSFWPRKDKGENAARKALKVQLNSGESYEEIYKACRIYSLDHEGDEYVFYLNNFLMLDHWKDCLEHGNLEKLESKREEAIHLIESWNKACRPHWCKSIEVEVKIPMAQKALSDKYFQKEWKKALDLASKIFKYPFRDTDSRSKLILSFRWFANVSHDKHTVAKIIEGEYGSPQRDISKKQVIVKKISDEERKELVDLWKSIRNGDEKETEEVDPFAFD